MRDKSPILSAWRRSNAAPHSLWGPFGETAANRGTGWDTHTEWTAATFHNAKFGARSGATPQDAQERRDAFPFPLPMADRETDTRSNYTRTILDNGICANMDRLAPDKARARVAGVIHSVVARRDTTRKQQTPRSAAADRSRWPGQSRCQTLIRFC